MESRRPRAQPAQGIQAQVRLGRLYSTHCTDTGLRSGRHRLPVSPFRTVFLLYVTLNCRIPKNRSSVWPNYLDRLLGRKKISGKMRKTRRDSCLLHTTPLGRSNQFATERTPATQRTNLLTRPRSSRAAIKTETTSVYAERPVTPSQQPSRSTAHARSTPAPHTPLHLSQQSESA